MRHFKGNLRLLSLAQRLDPKRVFQQQSERNATTKRDDMDGKYRFN